VMAHLERPPPVASGPFGVIERLIGRLEQGVAGSAVCLANGLYYYARRGFPPRDRN